MKTIGKRILSAFGGGSSATGAEFKDEDFIKFIESYRNGTYEDEYNKNEAKKLFERIRAVKKPRWL